MYGQIFLMGLACIGAPAALATGFGAFLGRHSGKGGRILGAQLGALLGYPCIVAAYLFCVLPSQELTEFLCFCSGPTLMLALVGGFSALVGGTLGSRVSERAITPSACLAAALVTSFSGVLLLLNSPSSLF